MPDDPLLDLSTLDAAASTHGVIDALPVVQLSLLAHPSAARVGGVAVLRELDRIGGAVHVTRAEPLFSHPIGQHPLASPFVSRKPLTLTRERTAVRVDPGPLAGRVRLDGQPLEQPRSVPLTQLDRGVVVRLGSHVVALLHRELPRQAPADLDMVGASLALDQLRQNIAALSTSQAPVLIRGETGSGKEKVAQALHATSARRAGPFVAVNMAAVPPQLAASQLFGHVRGAFSGAQTSQDGLFAAADRGTLFLDEVGDTPDEVQAALLRVLETHEVRPVGATRARRVDVRVVAATDADLEVAIEAHRFRGPLYWRLAASELRVPPLRERRADLGRLLIHFLRGELRDAGRLDLLEPDPTDKKVWLSADVVERVALHPWPGNVRELRNLARFLAPLGGHGDPLTSAQVRGRLTEPAPSAAATPTPGLRPRDIGPELLEQTLQAVDWALGAAAERLGISRPALNDLVDAHPTLARAKHLTDAQIAAGRAEAEATGAELYRVLQVSKRGLTRRLRDIDRADG